MAELSKPKVEVVPVAWTGDNIVTKYQAKVTLIRPNEEVKILVGDPKSSEGDALKSLTDEVMQRKDDIKRIIDVLNVL